MHAAPAHYHYHADFLTCIEHIWWKSLEACVNVCWEYSCECVQDVNKSEVWIFPIVHIFFRGCVPGVFVLSYTVGFIYIQESWVLCLLLLCSLMVCANNLVHYDPTVASVFKHIKLHYHHYADLSEGIELLKCLPGTFCLECVSRIKSDVSAVFHAIYGAVRIQLPCFSYDDFEHTCTFIKSEVWPIYHSLCHETMVCVHVFCICFVTRYQYLFSYISIF